MVVAWLIKSDTENSFMKDRIITHAEMAEITLEF